MSDNKENSQNKPDDVCGAEEPEPHQPKRTKFDDETSVKPPEEVAQRLLELLVNDFPTGHRERVEKLVNLRR